MKKRSKIRLSLYLILSLLLSAMTAQGESLPIKHSASDKNSQPLNISTLPKKDKKTLDDKLKTEWRLRMSGSSFNDDRSQSKSVDFRLDFKSIYNLTSNLQVDIQPSFRLVTGQSQTIDGADKMDNKILLNHAAIHFMPFYFSKFSAGALSQRYMHTSLLIDDLAFPAARAVGLTRGSQIETSVSLETAIPTSTSLSTNTKELEATPSLNTVALSMKWGTTDLFLKSSIGYFLYNNLPSSVAQQSMLLGNSVRNFSEANYSFIYEHQGFEISSELQVPVTKNFEVTALAEYLKNERATDEDGTAFKVQLGTNIHITSSIGWSLKGFYFQVAPEAAVAYFNSRGYQTNRQGYGLDTSIAFKPENFKLGIQYYESEVLYKNPAQSHDKSVMLRLETSYANL